MKKENLPVIILVLILLLQVYLCYLGTALLRQSKRKEVPEESVPLEAFRQFLTEREKKDVEFLGWSIGSDECSVMIKKHFWDTGDEYGDSEHFYRMKTYSGYQWFYNRLGDYIPVPGVY